MSVVLALAAALPAGNPIERLALRISAAEDNPLAGLTPDWSVFGDDATSLWKKLLQGFWGLAIVVVVGFLIHGIAVMAVARRSHNPGDLREGKKEAQLALIALAALAALQVIVGAIINVASSK